MNNTLKYQEALLERLHTYASMEFAGECRSCLETDMAADTPRAGMFSYGFIDHRKLWPYVRRLIGPGAQGVDELLKGLIRAPEGEKVLNCWLADDEHTFVVFAKKDVSDLYGIIATHPDIHRRRVGLPLPGHSSRSGRPKATGAERSIHEVQVRIADGSVAPAVITSGLDSGNPAGGYCLELHAPGSLNLRSGSDSDYFDALMRLRLQLEPLDIWLLCFGARRDVWASGMQRDIGVGDRAYLLSYPRKEFKPERSIFDYAPPETIGTVEEQRAYFEAWNRERTDSG